MILPIYLAKKFIKALLICTIVSFSIFFIFSLIGNLSEKLSFKSILILSSLNSLQIFTYIPSHLFILSLFVFIFHLKSKSELIIIKEYIEIKKIFSIIFPIMALFVFIESKKDDFSDKIEKIKSIIIDSKNFEDTKIFISIEGNIKKHTIFSGHDQNNDIIKQYLSFESQNQKIIKGEVSSNLNINGSDLFGNSFIIYENNSFQYENEKKILFNNFVSFWSRNTEKIISDQTNILNANYNFIKSVIFNVLFYLCISMIFLSKQLVDRGINTIKLFLIVLSIFLYYLLMPKIILNNFEYLFQLTTMIVFVLFFFKILRYE